MGGEGIAIIVALAFVVFSLIPTINRKIAIISRTILDERFAPDLRILNTQPRSEENSHLRELNLNHENTVQRSKIYYSERKMGSKEAFSIREAARSRAMAKMRIRKRRSTERKILFLSLMLSLATLILWLAVPLAQLSVSYGIVGILFSSLSISVLAHTRKNNREADRLDREKIAKATQKLGFAQRQAIAYNTRKYSTKTLQNSGTKKTQKTQEIHETRIAHLQQKEIGAAVQDSRSVTHEAQEVVAAQSLQALIFASDDLQQQERSAVGERKLIREVRGACETKRTNTLNIENDVSRERKNTAAQRKIQSARFAQNKQIQTEAVQKNLAATVNMPSYTAKPKIQKRKVVPYTPNPEPALENAVNVPYRPSRIGERITNKEFAAPNPAPQMSGKEELRSDLLGSGSALDALLDRRRA